METGEKETGKQQVSGFNSFFFFRFSVYGFQSP